VAYSDFYRVYWIILFTFPSNGELNAQSTTEFIERLRRYIQDEASAQYKTLEGQWSYRLEEEQSLRLSDSERETLIRDNTGKLYMAATWAGQRLVITYVGEMPRIFKEIVL
jgi:hypothetical protein